MATSSESTLLERLAETGAEGDAEAGDALAVLPPNEPPAKPAANQPASNAANPKLSALLAKINTIKKGSE